MCVDSNNTFNKCWAVHAANAVYVLPQTVQMDRASPTQQYSSHKIYNDKIEQTT